MFDGIIDLWKKATLTHWSTWSGFTTFCFACFCAQPTIASGFYMLFLVGPLLALTVFLARGEGKRGL